MSSELFKILVVDDSVSIVNSLSQILKVSGYQVDQAYNGNEAWRKMSVANYDLVISDIDMPGISGLEFLAKIRAEYGQKVAVILMTGYVDQEYFINAIRLGASDFIRKPIDARQIIRSIQTIISKRKEQDDMGMFLSYLDQTEMGFIIDPRHLARYSISNVFSFMLLHLNLNNSIANEVLICIDEMIYNAFIHGTLGLLKHERFMETTAFRELVDAKLQEPAIAQKRIHFKVSIERIQNLLTLEVEDDGEGFDFEAWLHRIKTDQTLSIEENGRGLALMYHLSDELEFSKGGRKIKVVKHLNSPDSEKLVTH
ncbi:MAG: hypothetical protein CVU48_01715 [Candidatus Cloacimonetes bacterium HGW-Cloacimonetes-1]|jgi:DNA-binding response OmpR family regulator|nr:MAG: hypothetical protein CVU48_01715 [Candidatus Cloacimonetes bacterium HGW-Cloacimonetes-1]